MISFILGLSIGLTLLLFDRLRSAARLKALLKRTRVETTSPAMSYVSRIGSAIATQISQIDTLSAIIDDYRQILNLAPLGYLYLDDENRLLWCNLRACELLLIEQADCEPPQLLLAIVRSFELDQLVERTRHTQTTCQQDWTVYSISPDPSNVLERPANPLRGYGIPLQAGHVGIFLENRHEAVTLAQQRDRWTSDVAHELKTPLTSIRLVGETLRKRVTPDSVIWIDRLLNEVSRLTALVEDVLNLSQLEQHSDRHQVTETADIVQLIHQAWQSLEPLASLKQLQFAYDGPRQLMAEINTGLMYRVFVNLLDNAIKFSPITETIQVKLTPAYPEQRLAGQRLAGNKDNGLLIEVIDAGAGFAEKDLPYIFDRFFRSDPARSRPPTFPTSGSATAPPVNANHGTGLGLAIVQKIIASHQGWAKAQNHPDTHGGWLQVWLPSWCIHSFKDR